MKSKNVANLCFVLMPFSKDFKNQWKVAIEPAIKESGLLPWRGDEDKLGTNIIIRDVTKCISEAVLIIADITGRNPNVMYELGLAHAAKKNVIMLIQDDEGIPFDVAHVRFLKYDPLDLTELKETLIKRISYTLAMPDGDHPDLFPQLHIMTSTQEQELQYLRSRCVNLKTSVYPPVADIFFNNKLVGQGQAIIQVNPSAQTNSLSFAATDFYEFYVDITDEMLKKEEIHIKLDAKVDDDDFNKRVTQWLRHRRRDPNNPVLMKAIASYLFSIQEYAEAIAEAKELLDLNPSWYGALNTYGYIIGELGEIDESVSYYNRVIALKPNHYIGYYNLACTASLRKNYADCLSYIEAIIKDKERIVSYLYRVKDIFTTDSDFDNIKNDKTYGPEFNKRLEQISSLRKEYRYLLA